MLIVLHLEKPPLNEVGFPTRTLLYPLLEMYSIATVVSTHPGDVPGRFDIGITLRAGCWRFRRSLVRRSAVRAFVRSTDGCDFEGVPLTVATGLV